LGDPRAALAPGGVGILRTMRIAIAADELVGDAANVAHLGDIDRD
jgi:hypothetical protein